MTTAASCTLLLAGLQSACGQEQARIGTISFQSKKVFDPADSSEYNFIGSIANSLHWQTRERVIRDELLFARGDLYDPRIVYESERNLRGLGIVGNVSILCDTSGGDSVGVTVLTQDKWTLGLNTGYKQGGGTTSFYGTLKDDNLFGTGQKLSAGYNYSSDRPNPNGEEIDYIEPRTFGSRWRTRLQLTNSDDQRIQSVFFERPFFRTKPISREAPTSTTAARAYGSSPGAT